MCLGEEFLEVGAVLDERGWQQVLVLLVDFGETPDDDSRQLGTERRRRKVGGEPDAFLNPLPDLFVRRFCYPKVCVGWCRGKFHRRPRRQATPAMVLV